MLYAEDTCKRLVAAGSHREEVYNREGQLNATFCEKEKQRPEHAVIFEKNRSKLYIACSDMVPLTGIEPVRFIQPRDFKSLASANSATAAQEEFASLF